MMAEKDEKVEQQGDGGQDPGAGSEQMPEKQTPTREETPKQKLFTQADMEYEIGQRLKREREKYADYKDLQAAAAKLKEIEETQLSETERLQKKLAELEQAKGQAETLARDTAVRSAVIAAAAKLNFNDPNDAFALIDVSQIQFDDEGQVKNAEALVEKLAKDRDYLLKRGAGSLEPFAPGSEGSPVRETAAQMRQRIYGGGGIWDMENPESQGGGVFWPKGLPDERG